MASHVIPPSELNALVFQINKRLVNDPDVGARLPIDPPAMLFEAVVDGLLLSKLISEIDATAIDAENLNRPPLKTQFQVLENHTKCINAARKLGCIITNIGPLDLMRNVESNTQHLVMGLLWQIVKFGLMSKLTVHKHPELIRLVGPGEDLPTFLKLAPEDLLCRWVNYHLKRAGASRVLQNFEKDIVDSEIYSTLLHQLCPSQCPPPGTVCAETDLLVRAELVLRGAAALGCREFVTPADVVAGNGKLNLAFVANLFNKHPGIQLPSEEELRMLSQTEAEMREHISKLRSNNHQLQADLSSVSMENAALSQKVTDMAEQLGKLESEHHASTEELWVEYGTQCVICGRAIVCQQLAEAEQKKEQLTHEHNSELEALRAALKEMTRQRDDALARLDALKAKAEQDASATAASLAAIQKQMAAVQAETTKSQNVLSRESSMLSLKLELNSAQLAKAAYDFSVKEQQLGDEISQLKTRIAELEAQLATALAERDEARAETEQYKEANARGMAAYEQVVQEKEALHAQLQELNNTRNALEAELKRTKATNALDKEEWMTKNKDLTKAFQGVEQIRGDWEAKYAAAQSEVQALTGKCASQQNMIDHLSGQKQRSDTHIYHLRTLYTAYGPTKKLARLLYDDCSADKFERMSGVDSPTMVGSLFRIGAKEPKVQLCNVVRADGMKPFRVVLKDIFLMIYKPDKPGEPHEVYRVDDSGAVVKSAGDQHLLELSLMYPEPQTVVLGLKDAAYAQTWQCAIQLASEWWTDNKKKREKLHTLSRGQLVSPTPSTSSKDTGELNGHADGANEAVSSPA